jgi:hypothetical protein
MLWRLSALALALFLAACAPKAPDPSRVAPPADATQRPKFEPVPLPLTPPWWRLIST